MTGTRFIRWLIPVGMAVALTLLFRGGVFSSDSAKMTAKPPGAAISVTLSEARVVAKTPALTLTGGIEGETSAAVSAKISGRVARILVEDGQAVRTGQPLVELENVELANAVRVAGNLVRQARANVDNLSADHARYLMLFRQNAVSRQQFDAVETRLKVAEAELSTAQATLGTAQEQYGYSAVASPVGGLVANRSVTVGQVLAAGMPMMSVENIASVYAVVSVEQKDMGVLRTGLPAELKVDAFPARTFSGSVAVINPAAAQSSRMFRTKIAVPNSDGSLKPGMFVKVRILTGEAVMVLAVPQAAVFQKNGLSYVYTVDAGKAVRIQVDTGDVIGDLIEIRSGLREHVPVVTANVNKLKDGDAVLIGR